MASIALTVEFLADGRCRVMGSPDNPVARRLSSADLSAEAPGAKAEARSARALRPSDPGPGDPAGGGFRCPLPWVEIGARSVDLRVVLPAGVDRADDVFPRLAWHRGSSGWIGTATLPTSPAFVSLHRSSALGTAGGFGWNFYGFFVFAAAFIAIYFAWVRSTHRPTADRG